MDAAAIGNESSSTTLPNTNMLGTVTQFQRSVATRVGSGANANAKTDAGYGVEENVPDLQFSRLSLGLKKWKRQCGREGQGDTGKEER